MGGAGCWAWWVVGRWAFEKRITVVVTEKVYGGVHFSLARECMGPYTVCVAGRELGGATSQEHTMTKTTAFARIEYRAANTDRGAVLHNGYLNFGRWENGEFICAHFPAGRSYKTEKGADRAAAKWMAKS